MLHHHTQQEEENRHSHGHHHGWEKMSNSKLLWVTLLNFSITLVQIVGGIISNSLSLLSDAIHNLGDSIAIFIAFLAGKMSNKKADVKHTFGHKRIQILAALFNALVLIVICIYLLFEAYQRLKNPEPIKGKIMLIIASFGLLANLISVFILKKTNKENLNVRAAYLHLLGDTLSSVAVIAGGIAIWLWGIVWIDPIITTLVSFFIMWHTWHIVKETVSILMQSVPQNINLTAIKNNVEMHEEVDNLHHLHIWNLDDNHTHLEAHINLKNNITMLEMMHIKSEIEHLLREKFNISHITLQMGYNCCKGNEQLIM